MDVKDKYVEFDDFVNGQTESSAETMNEFKGAIDNAFRDLDGKATDGILANSVIGYDADDIPEGYEEINTPESLALTELLNPTLHNVQWTSNAKNVGGGYYQIGKLVVLNLKLGVNDTGNVEVCSGLPKPKDTDAITFATASASNGKTGYYFEILSNGVMKSFVSTAAGTTNLTYRVFGCYICK